MVEFFGSVPYLLLLLAKCIK
ncbi:hypothetical protein [Ancylomarina sp. 16SWW S1-10-2]